MPAMVKCSSCGASYDAESGSEGHMHDSGSIPTISSTSDTAIKGGSDTAARFKGGYKGQDS